MNKTRVVLATESPRRREALRNMLLQDGSVEVLDEVADPVDLLLGTDLREVDVVVHTWAEGAEGAEGASRLPGTYSLILTEYPDLSIVGIPPKSDRLLVCRQEVVADELPLARFTDVLAGIRHSRSPVNESSN